MGNMLPTLVNAGMVAALGAIVLYYLHDRFEQVDKRFEQVDKRFEQVDARFEQVDARFEQVDARFAIVHEELRQLRSEVFQVAMALGVKARPREASP